MDDEQEISCNQLDKLEEVRDKTRQFVKRRLLFWAVRWTIGFLIIWVIVHYYPSTYWLWGAGAFVALLSLSVILGSFFFLEHKLKTTNNKVQDLEELLKEEEERERLEREKAQDD